MRDRFGVVLGELADERSIFQPLKVFQILIMRDEDWEIGDMDFFLFKKVYYFWTNMQPGRFFYIW